MIKIIIISSALVLGLSACQTTKNTTNSNWKCSANGLVDFSYSGGDTANIHLQGYSRGGDYPVTFNQSKTQVTGVTGNSTDFVCDKK